MTTVNVPHEGLYGGEGYVAVNFSHDGRLISTGGFGAQTSLWETETGKLVRTMSGKSNMAYDVSFSPDGTQLSSGGRTRWDLATGRGMRILAGAPDRIFGFPSPDGRRLAVMSHDSNAVKLVETTTGRQLHTLAPAGGGAVSRARFSPDGRLLITTYRLTEAENKAKADVDAKQQAEDMQKVTQSKEYQKAMQEAMKKASKAAAKNPADAMKIMTEMANVYNQQALQQRGAQQPANIEEQVKVWDVATGREMHTLNAGGGGFFGYGGGGVTEVEFSRDGRTLATLDNKGGITLWDVATGSKVRSLGAPPAGGYPGGDIMGGVAGMLASGSMGGVTSLAFSPDGRLLASGGVESKSNFDQAAMMSAAMSGRNSGKRTDPQDMMKDLKIESTAQIKIWDASTGQQVGTLTGGSKDVQQVAFSDDGRLIASSGTDNRIRLWDVASRQVVRTLAGQASSVNSMAFSPDTGLLAAATDEGATILWDAKTGDQLATLVSLYDGGDWLVVTPDGLFDGSPAAWNQVLWRYAGDTFNVAPIEWFFNEFYSPGLLADLVAGKRPKATEDISLKDRRQPSVALALDGAQSGGTVSTRTVGVRISVTDAPAGARDVRLFRN
ncbi:MAG: WD40 repeat domain-containing protein, partial [Pyrinomonadaceae bacterium]